MKNQNHFSFYHKPTKKSFWIVGACYALTDKKAFIVRERESDPKERTFLIEWEGKLTFDVPRADIEALWSSLFAVEAKRAKKEADKAAREERKRLSRVRRQQETADQDEQDALGPEREPWSYEPECEPDLSDEDEDSSSERTSDDFEIVESEIIQAHFSFSSTFCEERVAEIGDLITTSAP